MVAFRTTSFGGMVPAIDDRLLPDPNAAYTENTWLQNGALTGMHTPKVLRANSNGVLKVYRIPISQPDIQHISVSYWLEFADADTDILKAPVVNDTFKRYYFASPTQVPQYNTQARIIAATNALKLGIPAPVAGTLGVAGGSAANVTRAYTYTWVSAYGEEGPPAPPVSATNHPDGTWTLTMTAAAANDTNGTDRNLATTNIYRTITASDGTTTFFFVASQAIGTLTYADSATDATVALNSTLPSTTWTAPPTDLQGFVQMPNGMFAGFRQNEIWFCEPYRPHAWPAVYTIAVEFPVVGLGVVGQTLIVCTQGYPVAATGSHPSVVTSAKLSALEPCTSRASIISTVDGVYYTSPNGLILVAQGVATNVTRAMIPKDKWNNLFNTSTLRAAKLGDAYYAFGSQRSGVFETTAFDTASFAQTDNAGATTGMLINPKDQRLALSILTNVSPAMNVYNDTWTGEVFIVRGGNLNWVDISGATAGRDTYIWKSKVIQTTNKKNFRALRIYWGLPSGTTLGGPGVDYGTVQLYADGNLVFTRNIVTSGELMKLPSGYTADFHQIVITSKLDIYSVQMATTAKELASV
jgi:hypothetical protein